MEKDQPTSGIHAASSAGGVLLVVALDGAVAVHGLTVRGARRLIGELEASANEAAEWALKRELEAVPTDDEADTRQMTPITGVES